MKKVIALMALIAMTSINVSAQDTQQQGRKRMTKEEMLQKRTDSMSQEYGLSDSQKKQLLELNTKYADVVPMMGHRHGGPRGGKQGQARRQGPPPSDNGAQGSEAKRGNGPGHGRHHVDPAKIKEYETALSQIMSKEQYAKYEENKKARMDHRKKAKKDDSK